MDMLDAAQCNLIFRFIITKLGSVIVCVVLILKVLNVQEVSQMNTSSATTSIQSMNQIEDTSASVLCSFTVRH